MLTPIPIPCLRHFWPELWQAVAPSLEYDAERGVRELWMDLFSGQLMAWRATDNADGFVITSVGDIVGDDGRRGFWIVHIGGLIEGPPKARADIMIGAVSLFERQARALGCEELRIEGRLRAWGRVLPGFVRDGSVLKKDLT